MDMSVKYLPNYSKSTLSSNIKRSVTPAILNRKAINKIISNAKEILDRDIDRYLRPKKTTTPLPFHITEIPTRRCKSACAKMLETQAVYSNLIHPTTRRKSITNQKKKPADKSQKDKMPDKSQKDKMPDKSQKDKMPDKSQKDKMPEKTKCQSKLKTQIKAQSSRDITYKLLMQQLSNLKSDTSLILTPYTKRPHIISDISSTSRPYMRHSRISTTTTDHDLIGYSKK